MFCLYVTGTDWNVYSVTSATVWRRNSGPRFIRTSRLKRSRITKLVNYTLWKSSGHSSNITSKHRILWCVAVSLTKKRWNLCGKFQTPLRMVRVWVFKAWKWLLKSWQKVREFSTCLIVVHTMTWLLGWISNTILLFRCAIWMPCT